VLESNNPNIEENGLCGLGDSCKEIAETSALSDTEFHLRVLETDILVVQESEPLYRGHPGARMIQCDTLTGRSLIKAVYSYALVWGGAYGNDSDKHV
jgi:hypothetical protein